MLDWRTICDMALSATERLAAFVRDHPLLALCVACLGTRLDLDLDTATVAFAEVALRPGYYIQRDTCLDCGRMDLLLVLKEERTPC
jgi:hypothetical protein